MRNHRDSSRNQTTLLSCFTNEICQVTIRYPRLSLLGSLECYLQPVPTTIPKKLDPEAASISIANGRAVLNYWDLRDIYSQKVRNSVTYYKKSNHLTITLSNRSWIYKKRKQKQSKTVTELL